MSTIEQMDLERYGKVPVWRGRTKAQLIQEWLEIYPEDSNHPDLEFNSIAGHVEMRNGLFLPFKEWKAGAK